MRKFNHYIHILFLITTVVLSVHGASETAEPPLFRFSARTEAVNEKSAYLELSCILAFNDPGASIEMGLQNPQGKLIAENATRDFISDNWFQQANISISIENPQYWNAEQPNLYQLNFVIKRSDGELIIEQHRIGLAEYAVNENKLTCNQTPIVFQGVQYSLAHPTRSTPFSIDNYREDISLMQQMNFNAVRVIGAAPPPEFTQLCDEIGMYVLIDVGETDAAPTIQTYQNHPSVFAWNLDSRKIETDNLAAAIKRIKNLDRSHPLLVQSGSIRTAPPLGDGFLITNPPRNEWRFLGTSTRPSLACDLLPAMGHSIEGAAYFFAMARANASLRGGFIQQFADIASNADPAPLTAALIDDRAAQQQWAFGHDGLLNADRTPQPDFWQTRQVLNWIELEEREVEFRPGRSIELSIKNWHSFTNLNAYDAIWFLQENGAVIEQGEMKINLPPQRSMKIAVRPQHAQPNPDANTYLVMQLLKDGEITSEHSVWLKPKSFEQDFTMRLRDLSWDKNWTVTTDIEESRIDHHDFIFHTRTDNCAWFLLAREGNRRLITDGPFLDLNRSLTPPERLHALQSGAALPCEQNAPPLRVLERQVDRRGPDIEIKTRVASSIPECSTEVEAQIDLLSSPYGFCDVRFSFHEIQTSQIITEAGLSFLVPSTLDQIGWLGDGPHPAYPGMDQLSLPGFFNLRPVSSIIPGNRRRVQALLLTNNEGAGLGVLLWGGDVSIHPTPDGTMVRIQAAVAGRGDANDPTRFPIRPDSLAQSKQSTTFRLVPIGPGAASHFFQPWLKK
ncbi:MAG: glycoside hydrolase family 2 TIM barrel-domain containing protein [Candidatus Hinthialibacter antarcticus]|nr:glycoside hydrolase family 2 TIM barrel-domain containing protein [Candidatus Hinthialibacter antarcticus]